MQQVKDKINEAKRKSQTPVVGNMDPLLDALNQISQHEYTKKKEVGRLVYSICIVFHFSWRVTEWWLKQNFIFHILLNYLVLLNHCPGLLFLKWWGISKQFASPCCSLTPTFHSSFCCGGINMLWKIIWIPTRTQVVRPIKWWPQPLRLRGCVQKRSPVLWFALHCDCCSTLNKQAKLFTQVAIDWIMQNDCQPDPCWGSKSSVEISERCFPKL